MQSPVARVVLVAVAVILTVSLVAIAGREPLRGDGTDAAADAVEAAPPPASIPDTGFPVPGALPPDVFVVVPDESLVPDWLWWAGAGAGLAALAIGGALHVLRHGLPGLGLPFRRRRRPTAVDPVAEAAPPPSPGPSDAAVARRAVEEAAARLRNPTDSRSAVIAAYARMEEVLAQRDLGRRASEAPREYLARVLGEHGAPDRSLITLTTLFEEARFSLHPIPASAPHRALSALEETRAALSAPRP